MKGLIISVLFSIVFWNLENFFDYHDDGISVSESEFSSRGAKHWTKKRFEAKIYAVSKTILWAGAPEICTFAEIENGFVLKRLCSNDILRRHNYSFIHYESHDPRGIDVALIYKKDSLEVLRSYSIPVTVTRSDGTADTLKTRDILFVHLRQRRSGEEMFIYVNHHPSKYGGSASEGRRIAAMNCLKRSMDSLRTSRGDIPVIACGDFNDTPWSAAFGIVEGDYENLGRHFLEAQGQNSGSIRFRGKWELIDNFITDKAHKAGMTVLRPPFLMTSDRQFPGEKPLRTYSGPRYIGGVSDHLPVKCIR